MVSAPDDNLPFVSTLDRTMDAVVLDVEAVAVVDKAALRRRIERLLSAGVDVTLVTGRPIEQLDGLAVPWPQGPGRLSAHRDGAGSGAGPGSGYRSAVAELAARGVPPDAVALVVGDVPTTRRVVGEAARVLPVADDGLLGLLDDQLWRRAGLRVPAVSDEPGWSVVEPVPPAAGPSPRDVLFTVGDGAFGTRGGLEEVPGAATVLGSGVWSGEGPAQHLLPGPQWTRLEFQGPAEGGRRMLDLWAGALLREDGAGPRLLRTLRFASAARPGVHVLRAEGPTARFSAGNPLLVPGESGGPGGGEGSPAATWTGRTGPVEWVRVAASDGWLAAAAVQSQVDHRGRRTVMRVAAYRAGRDGDAAVDAAIDAVRAAQLAGFERLMTEHRQVWVQRWRDADVEVPADPSAQLALRFGLFQLWVNASWAQDGSLGDEQAVGARGLSGPGYAGHVFWDADVFVLPAVATFCPPAARAMLQYRIRRLAQARALASASGRAGARYPWESAREGVEVTPSSIMLGGELIAVRTGEQEEHITADVAWAADRYAAWTGDSALLAGAGHGLVVETARYWASRIEPGPDGRGHITGVIGPDEYHETVDDNVFTNVMARWNLQRAAELVESLAPAEGATHEPAEARDRPEVTDGEVRRWRELAAGLVDGYDPSTGRHEQFAGYLALEPMVAADVAPLPFAADLMLGQQRVHASQLIKQPDVLMAHFLVPEQLPAGSLGTDLDLYVPRTSHGSSLSPAITAALLARDGRPDEALAMYRIALRLDLDDLTGSGAKGLHLATLGGVWQALLTGFLGIRVEAGVLHVDPSLPAAWPHLRVRLHVLGTRVTVTATTGSVRVTTDRPLRIAARGYRPVQITGEATFDLP